MHTLTPTAAGLVLVTALAAAILRVQTPSVPDAPKLQQMAARFAPTDIGADLSNVSAADRRVLGKLVDAAKIVDGVFLRQGWAGNQTMLPDLPRASSTVGRPLLHYILIHKQPWSHLPPHQAFSP